MTERGISVLPGPDERSSGPRRGNASITARFADTWPRVERPLRAYLASLGAPGHQIDDLVQETAARALERDIAYSDDADLRRWCFVVARRAWVDEVRRDRRAQPADSPAERPDPAGDEALRRVEDRHVVRQVERVLAQLRQADRDILIDQSVAADAAERNRRNVARHRARARLKVLIGPLAGAGVFGCPSWLRRLGRPAAVAGLPAMAVIAFVGTPHLGQAPNPAPSYPAVAGDGTSGPGIAAPGPVPGSRAAFQMPMPAQAAVSAPRSPASEADAAPSDSHPRVEVTAPAGTHVTLRRDDKSPGEPLVCLSGDLANLCVGAPLEPESAGVGSAAAGGAAAQASGP